LTNTNLFIAGDYIQREAIKKLIYKAKRDGVEPSYELFLKIVAQSYEPTQTKIQQEMALLRKLDEVDHE